jgi:ABC-2 type transport system permease protein
MSVLTEAATGRAIRHGPAFWLQGYVAMLRFEVLSQRSFLPITLIVQMMLGAGMAIMYGFFLGDDLPALATLYVATGIPALSLVPVGMVVVPLVVGEQRMAGSYDFVWSLPVPRLVAAAATFTVYTLLAIPGVVVALAVAAWRYDVTYAVSPLFPLAVVLVALMSASVGFGLAHGIANVQITNLITNVLVFVVLLFSPIIVPLSQFPDWLAAIHQWLPFHHMAVVLRDGLTEGLVTDVGRSWLVLGLWTVGSWIVAGRAVMRRR